SEGFSQLDLLLGERPYGRARQGEYADWISFAQQGNRKRGAKSSYFLSFRPSVFGVGENIGDMNCSAFKRSAAGGRASPRHNRISFQKFLEIGRRIALSKMNFASSIERTCEVP